ncbi:MAG: glycogen synthase GlgA [Deltaproteobacteria bacterium]|nr:glycogen synthase GlgA [Deltaproteobacteria bacterium]
MEVLFVAPEISPLAKTGGLADVAGALPQALAAEGVKCHLVMPLYAEVDRAKHGLTPTGLEFEVPLPGGVEWARLWQGKLGPCPIYLLENARFYDRPGLYGPPGGEHPDNLLRFAFFCRGAVELCRRLNLAPPVVHLHDWQGALLAAYLRAHPFDLGPLTGAKSVLTIHNLSYQGIFPRHDFYQTMLPPYLDQVEGLEFWGNLSLLKGGLLLADRLTTVSPTYAREIQTPAGGHGLEGLLARRARDLVGILNGADYRHWSPEADPLIPARYGPDDLTGKEICRRKLVERLGLEPLGPDTAVLGFVGRLAYQKGADLLPEAISRLLLDDLRVVILGTGDPAVEHTLRELARAHPGRVGLELGFSEELAHWIQAGSDLHLMPSRFEPCGLSQLYAMRYGTVPVVRASGGLRDTVMPFDPFTGQGTGFVFQEARPGDLFHAVREALWCRAHPEHWSRLVANCLAQDFSWAASAQTYAALYRSLV